MTASSMLPLAPASGNAANVYVIKAVSGDNGVSDCDRDRR